MRNIILTCLTIFTLAACGDNMATNEASKTDEKPTEIQGDSIAELTKNGPNLTTRQAKDAWFVHRIISLSEKSNFGRTECHVKSEFKNRGDVALYIAQAKYRTKLIENPPEGTADNQEIVAQVAPEFGKPNLNPLRPGETRTADMGHLFFPCEVFEELKLIAFIANAVNSDGTVKYRSVKDGAPALIVENQTNLKFVRDEN